MNFADKDKQTRYDEAAAITRKLLRVVSGKLPLDYSIKSTEGGGIDDISGHDCIVVSPDSQYSVQISVRPSYHFVYQDLLFERWEYPENKERVNGRSYNYDYSVWWHFAKLPEDRDWTWYEVSARKLKAAVAELDVAFFAGEMKTKAGTIKYVMPKPGDPAKMLYCFNPEIVATRFQRISVKECK